MDIRRIVSLLDYKRYDNMILDIPYPSTYVAQEVQYTDMKLLDEAIIRTMVEFTYRLWGSEECYYIFFIVATTAMPLPRIYDYTVRW